MAMHPALTELLHIKLEHRYLIHQHSNFVRKLSSCKCVPLASTRHGNYLYPVYDNSTTFLQPAMNIRGTLPRKYSERTTIGTLGPGLLGFRGLYSVIHLDAAQRTTTSLHLP